VVFILDKISYLSRNIFAFAVRKLGATIAVGKNNPELQVIEFGRSCRNSGKK
jgi:hypothetical protein